MPESLPTTLVVGSLGHIGDHNEIHAFIEAQVGINVAKANDNTVVHLTGPETIGGAKTFTAQATSFGVGAGGGTGVYVQLSGTPTEGYVQVLGTPADIPLILQPKGTASIELRRSGGGGGLSVNSAGDVTIVNNPAAGTQSGLLANFSFIGVRRLELGAADSAGTGFRTVRVPN